MPTTPVMVLTGFLGSGKTTLLTRLLRDPRLHDTAVIVNEFGEVGLDHVLVEAGDQEIILLRQGCVCCTLNDSLAGTLESLDARRISGTVPDFRRVIVETTGLADPLPVLHTLLDRPMLLRGYSLGRVITTVDATSAVATLARHEEAVRQVAVADTVLVTKSDLTADTRALTAMLRDLNGQATIRPVLHGRIAPDDLLAEVAPHLPARRRSRFATQGGHPRIRTLTLRFPHPVAFDQLAGWLDELVGTHGSSLLRVKGLVAIEGQRGPLLVQGAQHVFHPPKLLPMWPDGIAGSVLVFILDGMDPEAIQQSASARFGLSAKSPGRARDAALA